MPRLTCDLSISSSRYSVLLVILAGVRSSSLHGLLIRLRSRSFNSYTGLGDLRNTFDILNTSSVQFCRNALANRTFYLRILNVCLTEYMDGALALLIFVCRIPTRSHMHNTSFSVTSEGPSQCSNEPRCCSTRLTCPTQPGRCTCCCE